MEPLSNDEYDTLAVLISHSPEYLLSTDESVALDLQENLHKHTKEY